MLVGAACFGLWTACIEARLVYLQVIQALRVTARADRQQSNPSRSRPSEARSPTETARVLAYSVDADSIVADPSASKIPTPPRRRMRRARRLRCACPSGHGSGTAAQGALCLPRAQKCSRAEARRVRAIELKGVGFLKENRRYYPKKDLAAHVLGYVGVDNTGLAGLESTYDTQIRGRDGRVLVQTDARRHALFSRLERPATAGAGLELTLDLFLQHIAERELRAGVEANRAAAGTAVVMDPNSGEIGVGEWPTFNPNAFGR